MRVLESNWMKKVLRAVWIAIYLCILVNVQAATQWEVIRSGTFEGLAEKNGTVVIPPVYEAIGWSDGGQEVLGHAIGYKAGAYWGLISIKNKKITPPKFTILIPESPWVKGAVKGKFSNHLFYGLMDASGDISVSFKYFSIDFLTSELIKVSEYRNRSPHYGIVDNEGEQVLSCDFSSVTLLGDLIVVEKQNKKKLLDAQGKPVLDFWLDEITLTDQGYLLYNEGKYGLVSAEGQLQYEVLYKKIDSKGAHAFNQWRIHEVATKTNKEVSCDSLTHYSEGFWVAHMNRVSHLLSSSSLPFLHEENKNLISIKESLLLMQDRSDLKWSVYKSDGEKLLTDMDSIALTDHYVFTLQKNTWDVYNHFGRKLNEYSLEKVLGAQGKHVGIMRSGYWGWLDFNGEQLVKCKYDEIQFGISEESFIIKYVDKWGVADFNDEFVIAPEYDRIEKRGGLYVAYKGYAKRIFTADGNQVYLTADPVFGDAILLFGTPDSSNAVLPSGQLIDANFNQVDQLGEFYRLRRGAYVALANDMGDYIVTFSDEIQNIAEQSERWFVIRKEGSYGFVDDQGRLRIANRYDAARSFHEGLAAVSLINKWGFLNKEEQLVVQPFYDKVDDFHDGLSIVRRADLYGIVDHSGDELIKPKWRAINRQPSGNFVVQDLDGNYGLVDKEGATFFAPLFEYLKDTDGHLIIAKKSGKMGVMNYDGFTKYPFSYDDIRAHGDYLLFLENRQYH